jgi:hypothetical protein
LLAGCLSLKHHCLTDTRTDTKTEKKTHTHTAMKNRQENRYKKPACSASLCHSTVAHIHRETQTKRKGHASGKDRRVDVAVLSVLAV